jgi:hypothetical protein
MRRRTLLLLLLLLLLLVVVVVVVQACSSSLQAPWMLTASHRQWPRQQQHRCHSPRRRPLGR